MRVNADAAVPVVRHFVGCLHFVLWAGLAVHPFGRHQTDEVRVGLLYWYDLLRGRQIYVERTEDATAAHGRVAQAALLAGARGVDAAYFICVLRARQLLLVVVASASQVCALLYYLFGDTPGGIAGVKFLGRVIVRSTLVLGILILSPCIAALNGD